MDAYTAQRTYGEQLQQMFLLTQTQIELLESTLCAEKQSLLSNPSELLAITTQKQIQIDALEGLSQQYQQLLRSAGFDSVALDKSMDEFVAWCSLVSPSISAQWRELKIQIENCRDKNLVNGSLLELNRLRINQLLSILTQGEAGNTTYSASGKNACGVNTNSLSVKA